ncbi:PepSY-associated TM helix domain-containing protein [Cellvibrio fibrivorans]|uniref:Iron-regulated membrane protein n=1 Tax=Cellvibrio fibrivorans TaxID=126350 RepID=A0ABU1V159_9GAMM|nr:PepSY domain-containing protein [Cellvibrio fibrivorans]MDR7091172.1 putative iron-regulated membrane protein [Cellvibrio fibrivorans]
MAENTNNQKALYRTIWRWHFYAGIFSIPFVIILALTGAIYLFKPYYEHWQERDYRGLQITGEALAPNHQIAAALAAIEGGKLLSYRLPQAPDEAVLIKVQGDTNWMVFVNPYTGAVLAKERSDEQLMNIVKTLHGELLLGTVGSILVELAACWAIVLIVTGLYLWWPRNAHGLAGIIYPRLRDGSRTFWRDIHAVTGIWISAFALFLLVTGLPWALVWGAALKEVRAVEFSKQQDWIQSRAQEHDHWRAQASNTFNLTPEVLVAAQQLRLPPPVELSVASTHHISWKASSQTGNRPERADVWLNGDGSIEKQSGFAEKKLIDRAIGVGIAAHEGYLFGWFNLVLGVLTCVGLILISVSGFILWRKRKPDSVLGAPQPMPARIGFGIVAITIGLAIFLPLLAISLVALLIIEFILLRRISGVSQWLGLSK